MIAFHVSDMTCGHCSRRILEALRAVDAGARVEFSMDDRRVEIDGSAGAQEFEAAIRRAGYAPERVGAA